MHFCPDAQEASFTCSPDELVTSVRLLPAEGLFFLIVETIVGKHEQGVHSCTDPTKNKRYCKQRTVY